MNWVSSKISAAYGAAMISALSKNNENIEIKNIIKGDFLASS